MFTESFDLATDDICHFGTIERSSALDCGVTTISVSLVWSVERALALICTVGNTSVHLRKIMKLLHALCLLDRDSDVSLSPVGLASCAFGVCQWFHLLARHLLSVFFQSDEFARRTPPQTQREESEIFDIQKCSKQGDPLSSLLFNTVLQYALKNVIQRWQRKKGMGIYLSDQERDCLTNLRFADDVMLFATSKGQIQNMMCEFKEATEKVGLTIHPNKTKILSNESSMNSDKKDT